MSKKYVVSLANQEGKILTCVRLPYVPRPGDQITIVAKDGSLTSTYVEAVAITHDQRTGSTQFVLETDA